MKKRISIIEDDMILAAGLKNLLNQNNYQIIGTHSSGESFFKTLDPRVVDLVIIDVMLKGNLSGIDIGKRLKINYPELPFVFLTGLCDEQTVNEILQLSPICYLKKPYDDATLLVNLKIAFIKIEDGKKDYDTKVKINDGKRSYQIDKKEILFLLSDGNYVCVHLKGNQQIMVRAKLNDLSKKEGFKDFIRTHVRFLVNPDHIFHYNYRFLEVQNHKIPISEKYRPEMRLRFK